MESLLSASSDQLIHHLDFSIGSNSASYVEDRSEVQWHASSNYFSPTGVRTIRVNIAGNQFVDLSTLVLVFTLHNDDGTNVMQCLTTGPHCLFSRYTSYVSGAKAEDILHYNCA